MQQMRTALVVCQQSAFKVLQDDYKNKGLQGSTANCMCV